MEPTVLVGLLTLSGVVFTGLVGFLGVWLTRRATANAAARTAANEETRIRANAYNDARADYQEVRAAYRELNSDLQAQIDRQEKALEKHSAETAGLRSRVDELEGNSLRDRRAFQRLLTYARALVEQLRDNQIIPLDPPDGVDLTTPDVPS